MKGFLKLALFAVDAIVVLQGCTLREPDDPVESLRDADGVLIKEVSTPSGREKITFEYDQIGRCTHINWFGETEYEIFYSNPLTPKPYRINEIEYGEFSLGGVTVKRPRYITKWKALRFNSDDCLEHFYATEYIYDYRLNEKGEERVSYKLDTYNGSYYYDNTGRLTSSVIDDETSSIIWNDGDLAYIEEDNPYVLTFTSSDVENTAGQWDPLNEVMGPLACTGWFGKAPAHFLKSETYSNEGSPVSSQNYSYKLYTNFLIDKALVQYYEDGYTNQIYWDYSYIPKPRVPSPIIADSKMLIKQIWSDNDPGEVTFDYDDNNRCISIDWFDSSMYEIKYSTPTAQLPSYVKTTDYYYYSTDGGTAKKEGKITEWSDLRFNADNCLIGYNVNTTIFNYSGNGNVDNPVNTTVDNYTATFGYDDTGRLTSMSINGIDIQYEWDNGDLRALKENGDTRVLYASSDVVNRAGQWNPLTTIPNPLASLGWYGKAPAHFIKSATYPYVNTDYSQTTNYSYDLLNNGLINEMSECYKEDGAIAGPVWKYSYIYRR